MNSVHWYDWVGLIGVALTLLAYFLLQAGSARGNGLPYQLMNALGAFGVLVSLVFAFNLSAFIMEFLWLVISIFGIVRGRRLRRAQ
jgi:paired small multidrug resistance pump